MPMHRRKMKILWVLVAVGLVGGEKLDRNYLPPPGAHLAGGVFNDDKLELPKENFQYTNVYKSNDREATFNTTPDVRTAGNDGNMQMVTTIPGLGDDRYYNTNSTPFPSLINQTTEIPGEYKLATGVPQISTNYEYINDLYKPVIISYPTMSIQDESISIPDSSSKTIKVIPTRPNVPFITDLTARTDSSKTLNDMNPRFNEKTHHNYGISSTPVSNTDATVAPMGEFMKYSFSNMAYSTPIKDSLKLKLPPIQKLQGIDTSVKYPTRLRDVIDKNAIILNYENKYIPGGFSYSFDTSNGIHADESGTADTGVRAKGSYSYIGDDGILYKIEYTADENGFRPRGSHLPTPPPIPKEIQRVIEQAHRNKAAGIFDDGSYDDKKYGFNKYVPRLTNKAQDLLMTNKDLIKHISEKPRKNKNTEYEELRLQASTVDPSPTFEDTNIMQIVNSAQSIFGTSQGYNDESSTPSLTSNTVSHPDNYINTISSTFVTPTTFMPRLYTSKDFAGSDQSDRKTIEKSKDRVINTSNEHFTTPISTTFTTGIENYKTELPDRSHFEDNAFTQDFSGPKQNQDFDPNTGYYY